MSNDERSEQYPDGKIAIDDEGVAPVAIFIRKNVVIIHFHEPMLWVGLDADAADAMATSLAAHAAKLRARSDPQRHQAAEGVSR
jgi:hypothetical protein